MRYIGIIIILLCGAIAKRLYSSYLRERCSECEGYVLFLKHLRERIGCYLLPAKEAAEGFENEALCKTGFLSALSDSGSLREAFEKTSEKSLLPEQAKKRLTALFFGWGRGHLDRELRSLDASIEALEELAEDERAEIEKRGRVAAALIFAFFAGGSILIL